MSHNSKIILRYSQYKSILDTYISLPEFQEKATETMRSKRVTITSLCNYLGDSGVTSFTECRPQNVTGFLDSISGMSSSTKSGKLFILSVYCKIKLPKVAKQKWTLLQVQIGQSCKGCI